MNINNKSLGLISSVFAITMASTNPAGACEWLSRLCCGGDDEADSETTRLNIQSNHPPSMLTMGENSLTQQSIVSISMQTNQLALQLEERQKLLQERKEKFEEEKIKIALEDQYLKELEIIKATTKQEEVKISAEEFNLQQQQVELEKRKAALVQTPVKPKQPSRIVTETPNPTEELTDSSLIPSTPTPYPGEETEETSTPSMNTATYQQQLQDRRNLGQITDRAWEVLAGSNIQLATALYNAINTNQNKKIEIVYIESNNFKLRVDGKLETRARYF